MMDSSFKKNHANAAQKIKQTKDNKECVVNDTVVNMGHPQIQLVDQAMGILNLICVVQWAFHKGCIKYGGIKLGYNCPLATGIITQEQDPCPTKALQGGLVYAIQKRYSRARLHGYFDICMDIRMTRKGQNSWADVQQ